MLRGMKLVFVILLFITFAFTACSKKEIKQSRATHSTSEELPKSILNKIVTVKDKEGKSTDIKIIQKKIIIYTIDDEKKSAYPISTFVEAKEKLEVKNVLDSVLLELSDYIGKTKVSDISLASKSLTVNFDAKDKYRPFGKSDEVLILDCISYSILENFPEYNEIYFKINGEAYRTAQIKLSADKPFMSR